MPLKSHIALGSHSARDGRACCLVSSTVCASQPRRTSLGVRSFATGSPKNRYVLIRPIPSACQLNATPQEPFVLTEQGALREATLLIGRRQLWVHEIRSHGQQPEIASIVAITRTSDTVAAITKVYTNPRWRQRGCAERLTRKVCKQYVLP